MLKKNYLAPLAMALAVAFGAGSALAKNDGHGGDKHGGKHAEKHAEKAAKHAEKAEKHAEKAQKHAVKQHEKAHKQAFKDHDGFERQVRRSDTRVLGSAPRQDVRVGGYFNDDHRRHARDYYVQNYGTARSCPPGLAKKNNGCMPPGQAKKNYAVGQALPNYVQYYSVPQQVVTYLPPAPYGYRYVRVYDDIVLMSTTDRIIIDVLRNLLG
jgi:Ni/Co efflux regulator RcnB